MLAAPLTQLCVEIAQRRAESHVTRIEHARRATLRPEIAVLEKIRDRDDGRAHGPRFVHTLRPCNIARYPETEGHPCRTPQIASLRYN